MFLTELTGWFLKARVCDGFEVGIEIRIEPNSDKERKIIEINIPPKINSLLGVIYFDF
jgi:hypothetical protein